MSTPFPDDPFLRGNFAPVLFEADAYDLPIREDWGGWPRELSGTLYRNGPNPPFAPSGNYHLFSGQGMIHAFYIADGKVSYRNRWVATPRYRAERAAGRSLFNATGPSEPAAAGIHVSTGNTHVITHGGRLFALDEYGPPFELDPVTLAPLGFSTWGGRIADSFTAHPKIDPETGELLAFGYSIGSFCSRQMAYYVLDKSGQVTTAEEFPAPYCSMVHDFIVTRNFVVFPVLPLSGSLERARAGLPILAWEPDLGSQLGVLRRGEPTSKIRWFTGPPCYVFHPMNAWDDGERIYADVVRYPIAPLFPGVDGRPAAPAPVHAALWRWTIDTAASTDAYKEEQLDDLFAEYPRFDERWAGLRYRHGFFAFNDQAGASAVASFTGLAHLDLATGTRTLWHAPAGAQVSEPVFVPRSFHAPEGDGYLLVVMYRAQTHNSELLCFDARELKLGPRAAVQLSHRIPFGFHGSFRPT